MTGLVVTTIEELKALQKNRQHPAIIIESELANNLLVSGVITPLENGGGPQRQITKLKKGNRSCPMSELMEVLDCLSTYNEFELIHGPRGKQIRIYPKTCSRREGN